MWRHACLQRCHVAAAVVYLLISRSFPTNRCTCYNIYACLFWPKIINIKVHKTRIFYPVMYRCDFVIFTVYGLLNDTVSSWIVWWWTVGWLVSNELERMWKEAVRSNWGTVLVFTLITVAAWSKAWNVFAHSNTGIIRWNPTWGMDVCLQLFCVCIVLYR
jgi:hypothetical protein